MATPIGTLGTIPSLDVGGCVFTDLTTLKVLGGYCAGSQFATLRLANGTTGYQVTNGTTLTLRAHRVTWAGGTDVGGNIGYGDTNVGMGSGAAPTTPVWAFGDAAMKAFYISNSVAHPVQGYQLFFQVPSQKYPAMNSTSGTVNLLVYGYEA